MSTLIRVVAAFVTLIGLAFTAGGASAQTGGDTTEQQCVSADLGGQQLQIGIADRTSSVAIALPAGTISIPSARATDGYPSRVDVTQNSEKYEVEFLNAAGAVIAVSNATEDVPDFTVFGEWIGSLGSVELSEPAVAIRAHHRTDLPGDDSAQSLRANEITFCFDAVISGPTTTTPTDCTTDPDGTNPDGTPCNTTTTIDCGDQGDGTNPDGTPCNTTTTATPTCGDDGVTTNPDGTPCNTTTTATPTCGDDGVTTNPDGTPCNTTTTIDCSDQGDGTNPDGTPCNTTTTSPDEEIAGPSVSTTAAPTTTAAPSTTEAPATTAKPAEEVAGPTQTLPITGSESTLLLAFGGLMLLAGGALSLTARRLD